MIYVWNLQIDEKDRPKTHECANWGLKGPIKSLIITHYTWSAISINTFDLGCDWLIQVAFSNPTFDLQDQGLYNTYTHSHTHLKSVCHEC